MHEINLRRFRSQAARAARDTVYYGELFARLDLDPAKLRWEELGRIPFTPKNDLRDRADEFVRRGA